jgi:ribose transport system permease protein
VGSINGLIITKIKVSPLITTLGMMSIASSTTLVICGGYPIAQLPESFLFLGQGFIGGVPVSVLMTAILVLIGDILLRRTRWLRLAYYVGGNEQAAMLSGIPVNRVRILSYMFCSLMASFAGIISTSRLSAAFPLAGSGTEMRVISACVIGGCSLSGGEGSILGSLLGVLLMALINNGLVLLNVSIYWQGIVSGLILIAAVTFDMLSRRERV